MGHGAGDGWDVLAALPVAVVVAEHGTVRWANPRAAECLGRPAAAIAGQPAAAVEELAADAGFAVDWAALPGGAAPGAPTSGGADAGPPATGGADAGPDTPGDTDAGPHAPGGTDAGPPAPGRFDARPHAPGRFDAGPDTPGGPGPGAPLSGGAVTGVLRRSEHPLAAALLDRAAEALPASLNVDRVLARLVHLALGGLADACLVGLVDGRVVRRVAGALTGSGVEVRAASMPVDAAVAAVARRLVSARPELHDRPDGGIVADLVPSGPEWALLDAEPPTSAMVVPLRARGTTSGAAVLFTRGGRRFSADDLTLATTLADRAAVAVDNARLYRDRSEVAAVLQQALLPPVLPTVPGLSLGAAYRPAGDGATPGGDFYDAFPLDSERWAVAVGDVCGKGVRAATVTGLARHTIRAAAPVASGPADVLRAVNAAVFRADGSGDVLCCTAVVAEVVPCPGGGADGGGGAALRLASGGHPHPFVVRRDATVEELDVHGTLLGALPTPVVGEQDAVLRPGDALVLYTDGLVEARAGRDQFGAARLRRILGDCAGQTAAMVAERLVAEVESFVGGRQADDLAVLVVRADG